MLTAFAQLPPEHRFLFALSLLLPDDSSEPPPRVRGRPSVLTFRQRLRVAFVGRDIENSLAREGPTTRNPALTPLLKRIRRLRAKGGNGDLRWQINRHSMEANRLSTKADRLGRFHSTEILKPTDSEPEINKLVVEDSRLADLVALGLTERMVRSIRTDKSLEPFLAQPVWVPSEWEQECARQFSIIRHARGLLT